MVLNRRGISGIMVVLAAVILLLAYLYIMGRVLSASGENLEERNLDIKDILMEFVGSITTAPPQCEETGGTGCMLDIDSCKTYCTDTKGKKDGFCASSKTSCIDAQPCCCVCTG